MATTNQKKCSVGRSESDLGASAPGNLKNAGAELVRKLTDAREEMTGYLSQGSEQFRQLTRGHEGRAAMIALAAGFGVGFVIGCALVSEKRRPQTWRERVMAEGIGRKFIDRLEQLLPDSITERLSR